MQQHDVNNNNGDPAPVHVETRSFAFVLSFSNLTYSVKSPQKMKFLNIFSQKDKLGALDEQGEADSKFAKTKVLLNNISGEAGDGEIMAILGASGSGKSTLIDALANRIAKGSLKGTVKLNGEPLESTLQKTITAYVMQDDLLYPMLTVEETLAFSAEFRLPYSMSKSKKKARVEALIDQLGLRNVVNTVIGDEGHRGVSGGERRRVSIGVDIIHDPLLLFLDEPTSGLDSTSAFMVVKVLQKIAQSGSVVIMSIHQPSYRVCSLLDRMIILSKGQTAFSGSPSAIARYFSEFGHPIAENENWTEFALDLILELESSPGGTRSLVEFNKSWEAREGSREFGRGLSIQDAINVSIAKGKLVSFGVSAFSNPMWKEVTILSKRSILNSWRLPELFGVRLGAVVVTGFILGTTFWKLDNSPRGILERFGFFASALSTTYYVSANSLPVFLEERFIFMRETAYNTYRRSSYVISRSLVAVPAIIIMSISFAVLTFWALGLSGGLSGFWFFLLIILASFWAGSSVVTFFSGAVPSVILAYAVGIAFLSYYFFLSGFCINRDRIPPYWIWLHYLSLMKYTYEAMVHNEFDDPSKCFVRGTQMFDNTPIGSVPESVKNDLLKSISSTLGFNITSDSCVITGPDILLSQGVSGLSKWDCLWITIAWGFLFRILFYFTLLIGSKNKRR